MKDAYIVDIARSAVGKFGGTLGSVRPDDLAADVIKAIMSRNSSIDFSETEDVILGAANQAGEDNRNVARMSALLAGMPIEVPGYTVNRLCASGLQSLMEAAKGVMTGMGDLFIAGGVESMTRAPFVMAKSEQAFGRKIDVHDTTIGWRFVNPKLSEMYYPFGMGETAENVAEQWKVSREEQDLFAYNTQLKYEDAHKNGRFDSQIVPIEIPRRKQDPLIFDKDEHPRLSTPEVLGNLKPAFRKDGTVTAGNASGVNDGAAIAIVCSEEIVKKYNLKPMARIVSMGVSGVHPDIMGIGPVPATRKALKRAGLSVSDLGLVELNEAFASQSIACMRELELDESIVNVNGGSIAIGHPLGASGTRISTTLLHEMSTRSNVKYGLATMCIGVGQGSAIVFENLA
jgi:3-oxoadipyl-CoA thiolase